MIDSNLVTTVESIRRRYLEALEALDTVSSFRALLSGSERLRSEWTTCRNIARSPRMQKEAAISFSCAFVGSSGHGKTSILAEMFPDLDRRGWLGTDVTDTTSQALVIHHAPASSPDASRVTVQSWGLEQIRRLVQAADAENTRSNVIVRAYADHIEIDGTEAGFKREDVRNFKFPLKHQLRPLPSSCELTVEQTADPGIIRALTVKEPSERVQRGLVLQVGGQAFEALPLRAAIKEVDLYDSFSEILRWAGPPRTWPPSWCSSTRPGSTSPEASRTRYSATSWPRRTSRSSLSCCATTIWMSLSIWSSVRGRRISPNCGKRLLSSARPTNWPT
jgi:hypothetical protein